MEKHVTIRTGGSAAYDQVAEQDLSLRVSIEGREDTVHTLPLGVMTVGSAAECTLRVPDESVSRRHCEITRSEASVRIRDLGSTNGTAVDGVIIDSAYLRPSARIRLGKVTLCLEVAYRPLSNAPNSGDKVGFRGLVGQSPAMTKLFAARDRIAKSDVTVLIQGETGTGKSALARSIHLAGERRPHPFIVFDCSSVAQNLVDSALFGHEKGAFTGADSARVGALEAVGSGTLFIDELTELPLELQPKLLRALEEREFTPLGGTKPRPVTCRIIAATQHDIRARVEEGTFRRDLYFRLAVFVIPLPPLRDRKEDIPLIIEQLLFANEESSTPFNDMPQAARDAMLAYDWPGNIRELRNYLARLMLARDVGGSWSSERRDLPLPADQAALSTGQVDDATQATGLLDLVYKEAKVQMLASFERTYLKHLLEKSQYNLNQASRLSGINRRHLDDMLLRHHLDKKSLMSRAMAEED